MDKDVKIKDVVVGLDNTGTEFCENLVKSILLNDPYVDDACVNYTVFCVFQEVVAQIVNILDSHSNHEFYTQLQNIPIFNNLRHLEYLGKDIVREYFIELSLTLGVTLYNLIRKIINVTDSRYGIFFGTVTLHTLIIRITDVPPNAVMEVLL